MLRRRGGRLHVVADVTRGGRYPVGQDGAARRCRRVALHAGRQVVVVSAPDVPAAEAAEVVRVANRELPGLFARYRLPGRHPRAPVIFMTDSWDAAQRVSGVPMPHEAVGAEYAGLIYLEVPGWSRWPRSRATRSWCTSSRTSRARRSSRTARSASIEGVARYEEQRYAVAAGAGWPFRYLAPHTSAATRRCSAGGGRSGTGCCGGRLPTWLAYEDGAAIVRALVRDGGDAGLRRLGAAFRRDGVAGRFTAAPGQPRVPRPVGRSFAESPPRPGPRRRGGEWPVPAIGVPARGRRRDDRHLIDLTSAVQGV